MWENQNACEMWKEINHVRGLRIYNKTCFRRKRKKKDSKFKTKKSIF